MANSQRVSERLYNLVACDEGNELARRFTERGATNAKSQSASQDIETVELATDSSEELIQGSIVDFFAWKPGHLRRNPDELRHEAGCCACGILV
jgi:hypothetical protein